MRHRVLSCALVFGPLVVAAVVMFILSGSDRAPETETASAFCVTDGEFETFRIEAETYQIDATGCIRFFGEGMFARHCGAKTFIVRRCSP